MPFTASYRTASRGHAERAPFSSFSRGGPSLPSSPERASNGFAKAPTRRGGRKLSDSRFPGCETSKVAGFTSREQEETGCADGHSVNVRTDHLLKIRLIQRQQAIGFRSER